MLEQIRTRGSNQDKVRSKAESRKRRWLERPPGEQAKRTMSRGHTVELFATISDLIGSLSDAEQVEPLRYYAIHSSDPAPVPEESIAALGSKLDQTRLGYYLVSRGWGRGGR